MQKVNKYKYEVSPGERVTVKVDMLNGVGRFYEGSLDAGNQGRPANDQWAFTVTRPVTHAHTLTLWFEFPGAPPNSSQSYRLTISGSGGGSYTLSVRPDSPMRDFVLLFRVV